MTDNIKLPAPKFLYFEEIGELHEPGAYTPSDCAALYTADQVREAVRLNAQDAKSVSTEHGPWIESTIHEGETYCKRCLVRSVFAGHKKCEPHAVAVPAAQAVPEGWPPGPTLKGMTGEMAADDIAAGVAAQMPAAQQGDEREAFDQWFRGYRCLPDDADTTQYDEAFLAFKAWQARAALAQGQEGI